jgi:hypothetical protein
MANKAKPDFLDMDKDGNKKEPMKKAVADKKKTMTKEGLGDMAHMAERDHEVQMARAELYKIAKYAIKLHEMLKGVSEAEGIEGWMQSKITKAADYVGSVYHTLEYDMLSANQTPQLAGMSEDAKDDYKNTLAERMNQKKTKLGELSPDTLSKYHGKAYDDEADRRGSGDSSDENKRKIANRKKGRSLAATKHNKAMGYTRPTGAKKDSSDASKSAASLAKLMARKDRQSAKAEESLEEKAKSKAQQRFMGMVHATQKGEPAPSKEVAKVAKEMPKKAAKDYAATKHKGKPEHVKK